MKRRTFVGHTVRAALGVAAAELGRGMLPGGASDAFAQTSSSRAAACGYAAPGVQLYTVRDLAQRDPFGTLAALAKLGLQELELYGLDAITDGKLFGVPLAELKREIDGLGLRVPSAHIGGAFANNAGAAAAAEALGVQTLCVALPSEFSGPNGVVPAQSRAQLDMLAQGLDATGRELASHGIGFGYHNHHVEFLEVDGVVPFDYLMERTDPELVKIELDLGWLAVAGRDLNADLRRYAGRTLACHLKDYDPSRAGRLADGSPRPLQYLLVEPGAGNIDWREVLATMAETGVAHGYVEIDVSDDPLAAVERGHRHLQSVAAC